VPNEKMQPIQWTEWPAGALVAAGALWPSIPSMKSQNGIFLMVHWWVLDHSGQCWVTQASGTDICTNY